MRDMRVSIVVATASSHLPRVRSVVEMLNSVQTFFRFELSLDARLDTLDAVVDPYDLLDRFRTEGLWTIALVDPQFTDNWFSHENRDTAVITTADWEEYYAPPSLRAYLVYQVAQSVVMFVSELSEQMAINIVHEPPVGCLFDLSATKSDIRYGMLAGSLCPQCYSVLKQYGAPDSALLAVHDLLECVRREAIGRPIAIDPSLAFVVMRFTENDENDNAWKYGIKLGLEDFGFQAARADYRLDSAPLLAKISSEISRARLVVAKVDEKNLNVFFELGLAMGLRKETLLVSDNALVVDLPSDLRSWECVTYQSGNFESLRSGVRTFCEQRFIKPMTDLRHFR